MSSDFDILLVEDEQVVIDAVMKILRPEDFTVDAAADVESAMQKLEHNSYKLILSDLMLPGITGIGLVEKVKRERPHVPVIMISGYATLENAIKSFKVGAFDFIPKPFDIEELLGVVYRGINHYRTLQEPPSLATPEVQPGAEDAGSRDGQYYFLGQHSWMKLDPNGVCICGVAETFPNKTGQIRKVEFPNLNAEVLQGNACARIITQDDLVHRVWAPVSGNLVATNLKVEQEPDLINADPFQEGWLVKMRPTNLTSELENLEFRGPFKAAGS